MVFSTAGGALYAFICRVVKPGTTLFRPAVLVFTLLAYLLSFVGFSDLIGIMYPIFGWLGLLLIGILFVQWFRQKFTAK